MRKLINDQDEEIDGNIDQREIDWRELRNWWKNWLKRMRKLMDEDEEIDGKIDQRGWRNDSSAF
jgi:uncharacterized Zn ribbon protein